MDCVDARSLVVSVGPRGWSLVCAALLGIAGCGDDSPPGDTDAGDTESAGSDTESSESDSETGAPVTECGSVLEPSPTGGTCSAAVGSGGALVLRGTVLGPSEVFRGGEVVVDAAGVVQCAACDCSATVGYADASVVTCANGVISPSLINPHDHLDFVANAPIGQGVARYAHRHEWRTGPMALSVPGGASEAEILAAELRFVMSGTTSIAGASGEFGLLRNLDVGALLEGLPVQAADSDTFPLDDRSGFQIEQGCNYGADAKTNAEISGESAYLPHLAEGINAAARNELICTSTGATDLLEPQTAVIHAVGVGATEAQTLAEDATRVVWSPRSNIVLYGNTAPVTLLDRMGVAISLGTDWVASGSMNMLRELRCADELNTQYYNGYFSDEELWRMVTFNAALSTGTHEAIGKLAPGYIADIAVFAAGDKVDHQAVVEAELPDVALVLRGGTALYGDADLIASGAFGAEQCEPLDMCGTPKRACVSADLGGNNTFSSLQAAIGSSYPLFFCGVPDNEPSCVPFRDEYAQGITDADGDGDGIANDADNCPDVFNPVRPFEAQQGDGDQDGVGDVCDVCPLDPTDSCAELSGNDVDDDGVPNGADNCVFLANAGQEDADADGHGDACDDCPEPNPGSGGCALTIATIRNPAAAGHPAVNASVAVAGVYVTAIPADADGFYIQDTSLEPWSGIFVFTGSPPSVSVGNQVTVSGTYEEFFGLSEISGATVSVTDTGTSLPFDPVNFADPAELANGATAEPWESMLVSVGAVSITNANPDGGSDFDEFEVTGGLRIDDLVSDNANGSGLGNNCAVGDSFTSIVGIEGFSFENYKLLPRNAGDVAFVECNPFG